MKHAKNNGERDKGKGGKQAHRQALLTNIL